MNTFTSSIRPKSNINEKLTENGAFAYDSTGDALLNLFATVGAMRNVRKDAIEQKFVAAYEADKLLAAKILFYTRNIRGGLGERDTFRTMLHELASNDPATVIANFDNIVKFGRFDDFYTLIGTRAERAMWAYLFNIFMSDLSNMQAGKKVTLLAKWLKSANASSKETRALGALTAKRFCMTEREYRKVLSALREYSSVIEHQISSGKWDSVFYPGVPSNAMLRYRKAFSRHDGRRFSAFIENVKAGKVKIKASTLYPYDLVHNAIYSHDAVVEEQWKALPNYIEGENNILVMADVSGSMDGRPMETSVGLAIYFAERNKGDYHNLYMTFTDKPHFVSLTDGGTLSSKVRFITGKDVGYNTNLKAAFDYVLRHAVDNEVPSEDMPKAIIVVSDMQIDPFFRDAHYFSFVDQMRLNFAACGYELPKLVLWNVEGREDTFLAKKSTPGVQFFSGQSASTFRDVLDCIGLTSYEAMIKTLSNPMYDTVVVSK